MRLLRHGGEISFRSYPGILLNELEALVILNNTPLLGSVRIRQLVEAFGSAVAVLDAPASALSQIAGIGPKVQQSLLGWREMGGWAEDLEAIAKGRIDLISYRDARYPRRLLEIGDHPILLYVKGTLTRGDDHSVAVIGTRFATVYGREMAERISDDLVSFGYTVVSGLARGIDTAAHQGALKRGRTLAVLGCGLHHTYPKENAALAERIAQQGAVISEFPMHTPPDRQHFPQRNRIVSGMTMASLLIEAPLESGAMITMSKGHNQGRRLFAIPGRIDCDSFRGNHRLIKQGVAQLVESAHDVTDHLGSLFGHCAARAPVAIALPALGPEEQALLSQMPNEETAIDDIAIRTKQPITKLNVLLMSLVMKKQVREFPGKIYKKVQ